MEKLDMDEISDPLILFYGVVVEWCIYVYLISSNVLLLATAETASWKLESDRSLRLCRVSGICISRENLCPDS